MNRLVDLIKDVVQRVQSHEEGGRILAELNPNFKPPEDFVRMTYCEAIEFLRENKITKDDGSFYEFGEDIPEMPERKMTDTIGKPILLHSFPAQVSLCR